MPSLRSLTRRDETVEFRRVGVNNGSNRTNIVNVFIFSHFAGYSLESPKMQFTRDDSDSLADCSDCFRFQQTVAD